MRSVAARRKKIADIERYVLSAELAALLSYTAFPYQAISHAVTVDERQSIPGQAVPAAHLHKTAERSVKPLVFMINNLGVEP